MKNKLRIFFYATYQDGTGYYRMAKPAEMIRDLGLADVFMNPFKPNHATKRERDWYSFEADASGNMLCAKKIAEVIGDKEKPNYDAIIFQRMDTPIMFSLAMSLREWYNIPIIMETDDYVWDVPGLNPGVLDYYERKPESQPTPDDPVMAARRSLGTFDSYIVTTNFLRDFYKNYSPTYICPNSIDLTKRIAGPYKKHRDFRVMFSSSAGHLENLNLIKEPIGRLLKKYPQMTFYYYHFLPNPWKGTKLARQTKTMKWVEPDHYWKYINSLSPDVCLAPLTDRLYNRAKSNLRLLEYWTAGENAVIASPVGHYKETIIDGKNGLLAKTTDEWQEKIEMLMQKPKLRQALGKEGYKTVKRDFNLRTNAQRWVDAVRETIDHYTPGKQAPDKYLAPVYRDS